MELSALVACATHTVPGPEASVAIAREKERLFDLHGQAVVYEVVARPDERLDDLALRVAGRLVYYAKAKRLGALGWPRLTIALFVGDQLHFVPAAAFVWGLVAAFEIAADVLAEHVAAWEQGAVEKADFAPL